MAPSWIEMKIFINSNDDKSAKINVWPFQVISANALPVRYCLGKPIPSISPIPFSSAPSQSDSATECLLAVHRRCAILPKLSKVIPVVFKWRPGTLSHTHSFFIKDKKNEAPSTRPRKCFCADSKWNFGFEKENFSARNWTRRDSPASGTFLNLRKSRKRKFDLFQFL